MIMFSVIATIAAGLLGALIGDSFLGYSDLGIITAVAAMGGFIISAIKQFGDK